MAVADLLKDEFPGITRSCQIISYILSPVLALGRARKEGGHSADIPSGAGCGRLKCGRSADCVIWGSRPSLQKLIDISGKHISGEEKQFKTQRPSTGQYWIARSGSHRACFNSSPDCFTVHLEFLPAFSIDSTPLQQAFWNASIRKII